MVDLGTYIPFLLVRAGESVQHGFAAPLAEAGISLYMWRVLAVLDEAGPQSLNGLAEKTAIEPSTLSRLVTRMQRKRLISRTRSTEDGRMVHVRLAKAGRTLMDTLGPVGARYEDTLLETLTDEQRTLLSDSLRRLYEAGQRAAAEAPKLPPTESLRKNAAQGSDSSRTRRAR